jgi:hypothetical protein
MISFSSILAFICFLFALLFGFQLFAGEVEKENLPEEKMEESCTAT